MEMTRSIQYALIATGFIALNRGPQPILARRIAHDYHIPPDYLFKILKALVRADILNSARGPHGGYFLAREPETISLLQIFEAVEGPLSPPIRFTCPNTNDPFHQRTAQTIQQIADQTAQQLEQTTLADLIQPETT